MAKRDDSVKKKVPELRFKGFTDDWEQRKFKDILKTHSFRSYLAGVSENGEYEVIQQGDKPIVGYSDGEPFTDYKDVTLFGDHTVSLYKPKSPFFVATDGVKILSADNFEGNYLYTTLERYKPEPHGYKRHFTILKNQDVWFTENMEEQQKIGSFFKQLDETIALHQRKLDLLKEQKKGYLQKMFPKNGAKVPELRFAGFADDWEERKLKDIAQFNPKTVLPDEFEYVDLESVVGTEMISHRTESKDQAPSRAQRLAQKGDVFYQTVRPYQMNNYLYDLPYDNYVFSTGYAQMRPNIDSYFLLNSVQNKQFVQHVLDRSTGTSYPAINSSDLSNIEINVPSKLAEQQKIGSFFKQLDDTIALHQRKLDLLKEQKKGFLQKMFV
ncbi:restriction endonuclease subunit S [Streptococcus alactolyticus]|uniref:restriction endonuclease subunit S n=1 Tax=Streptococcus alactolyticus TaxID=29389 RepID=UPI003517CC0B